MQVNCWESSVASAVLHAACEITYSLRCTYPWTSTASAQICRTFLLSFYLIHVVHIQFLLRVQAFYLYRLQAFSSLPLYLLFWIFLPFSSRCRQLSSCCSAPAILFTSSRFPKKALVSSQFPLSVLFLLQLPPSLWLADSYHSHRLNHWGLRSLSFFFFFFVRSAVLQCNVPQ